MTDEGSFLILVHVKTSYEGAQGIVGGFLENGIAIPSEGTPIAGEGLFEDIEEYSPAEWERKVETIRDAVDKGLDAILAQARIRHGREEGSNE